MESTISPPETGGKSLKRSRHRSSPYPSFTIESSVAFTRKVDSEFSDIDFTPVKDISETLGSSGGAFLQQISSCVQYGLLEIKQKVGYKPSAHFKKIKKPLESENVNDLLIECLQRPSLYKRLLNDLREKQIPSEKGLANTLDRNYAIKGNAATLAAKVFLKNLTSLGLITEDKVLKLDGAYIPFEETDEEDENIEALVQEKKEQPKIFALPEQRKQPVEEKVLTINKTREIPVFLQGESREAKLILPIDFTEDDLKRIVKVLNAYLP
jgi:hypothetical protein